MIEYLAEYQDRDCGTVDAAILGDALIDYQYWVAKLPSAGGDETISMSNKSCGGSAANTAIALGQQHLRTAFCGRVGADENGRWITEKMKTAGVDISCMQYGESTGYVISIIDENSERTMLSYRGASAIPLEYSPELRLTLQNTKLLLVSGYSLMHPEQADFSLAAAKETRLAGGMVALDPSPVIGQIDAGILEKMLDLTDIIMPNKSELKLITGNSDIIAGVLDLLTRIPCIALKLGPEGSMAAIRKGFVSPMGIAFPADILLRAPAVPVTAIDTTGAGDAFNAGFIASMFQRTDPQKWIERGNDLAAKVVSQKGATIGT
ncbi:MAG: carbohydrate kinase family protein [Eubacteriales bacterium]